jgi:hypothetical protein
MNRWRLIGTASFADFASISAGSLIGQLPVCGRFFPAYPSPGAAVIRSRPATAGHHRLWSGPLGVPARRLGGPLQGFPAPKPGWSWW